MRRIFFIPLSGTCFLASYTSYQLSKIPGMDKDTFEVISLGTGIAGAAAAYMGFKPSKRKHVRCPECGECCK